MSHANGPAYTYAAIVDRWIDGDTVDLRVDVGFRITIEDRFRLIGIDTPERGRPGYREATARAEELAPPGTVITVKTQPEPGKYGRWLGEIILPDGTTVNDRLVAEGHAAPYPH